MKGTLCSIRRFRLYAVNAEAQCNIGALFAEGLGVSRNSVTAIGWYRKAAEQDYARAMYNLGAMYGKGEGVSRDYTEAEKWIRMAAEAGFSGAQYQLGIMFLNPHISRS
jgi:hypothetical protein